MDAWDGDDDPERDTPHQHAVAVATYWFLVGFAGLSVLALGVHLSIELLAPWWGAWAAVLGVCASLAGAAGIAVYAVARHDAEGRQ
jgi:hypothetical protein